MADQNDREPDLAAAPPAQQGFSLRRLLPLAVLAALIALAFWFDLGRFLSLRAIAENREALGQFVAANYLAAVLAFLAVYIVAIALSLPGGAILTITGGFLFGQIMGGLYAVTAATIGATIIFLIAKTSLGEPLAARAGPFLNRLRGGFRENEMSYLLFLRLVPVFPFWLVNLAPALLGVSFRTYVIGTFFGIIPGTFAFAFLGGGLDSIIEEQQAAYNACLAEQGTASGACTFELNPGALLTPELLLAFVALGIVALIPAVLKKLRARRAGKAPAA